MGRKTLSFIAFLVALPIAALGAPACDREAALNPGGQEERESAPEKFGEKGGAEMATAKPVQHLKEIEHRLEKVRELLAHVEGEPLDLPPEASQQFADTKAQAMEALHRLEGKVRELKEIAEKAEEPGPGPGI